MGCGLAFEGEAAGAGELEDAEGLEEAEEGVDLLVVAGGLDDEGVGGEVDDFGAEDLVDLEDLRAGLAIGADLHEHELAGDGLALLEIDDFDDVDELPELFDAEVELRFVAAEDGGDARQRRVVRGSDVEGVDVEAAAGKHP